MIISVSLALSQTLVYTATSRIRKPVHHVVCLISYALQLSLVRIAPIPTEGWPG